MTHLESVLINSLKDKYVNSDNKTCFYEREKVLNRIGKMTSGQTPCPSRTSVKRSASGWSYKKKFIF